MSNYKTIKNTLVYNEFSESNNQKFFTLTRSKFISHVDTFYFVVYVDSPDWRSDNRKDSLIQLLRTCSAAASESDTSTYPVFENIFSGLTCRANSHFNMYSSHFCLKDAFDVFIADYTPNIDTPPIFVQLRSNSLWLHGTKKSFDMAVDCVKKVLASYDLNILRIVENRFDYAYHTNYIQDLIHYFPDKDLKEMQISQFQRWHREGYFFDDNIFCDYFTLGRRKSNNVFFRIYDKTKEVIEMGYKQFFIPIWFENGLISLYDKYVLEHTFEYGSWNSKELARCHFYYEHGKDFSIRKQIGNMLQNPDTPYSEYKKLADKLVPDLTTICNVEFQCKRKFFYNIGQVLPDFGVTDDYMDHIYSLIDQTKSITNHLTSSIIRFVKYKKRYSEIPRNKRPDADWWKRLRSCKCFDIDNVDGDFSEYCFAYQDNLDLFRVKYNTLKSVARASAYFVTDDDDLYNKSYDDDFRDFYGHMNDNDVERYYNLKSASFDLIKQKKMKLDPVEQEQKKSVYSTMRYASIFKYWLSGIYYKRLDKDMLVVLLDKAFKAVPESQDVFLTDMEHYESYRYINDKMGAYYSICEYCLKKLSDKKGSVDDDF